MNKPQQCDFIPKKSLRGALAGAKLNSIGRPSKPRSMAASPVKLLDRPPSSEFDRNPAGYLYRAVVNEARSFLESRRRESLVNADITDLEIAAYADNEAAEQQEDIDQRLTVAWSRLDPHLAVLLTLRYELNYSCDEIAKLLRRYLL